MNPNDNLVHAVALFKTRKQDASFSLRASLETLVPYKEPTGGNSESPLRYIHILHRGGPEGPPFSFRIQCFCRLQ